MNKDLMFSSATDQWATPQSFFDKLNAEFNFTLDPCATSDNAKCEKYFTEADNGLLQDWRGETVFCNPPYSKKERKCKEGCKKKACETRGYHLKEDKPGQEDWVKKCYEESLKRNTKVVLLIPARTDTQCFHDYIYHKAKEIRFLKGRLKFGSAKNAAPFPSMLVVFYNAI